MIVSDNSIEFPLAPKGTRIARCFRVIDLGTKENQMYGKKRHQVFIGFELPTEMQEPVDDKPPAPFTIGEFYTASLSSKSHLRRDLESWRSKEFTKTELDGFDLASVLGVPCFLNVIHKEKTNGEIKASIGSIMPLPKGTQCPPAINENQYFSFEKYDDAVLETLPNGFQNMIRESEEYKALVNDQFSGSPAGTTTMTGAPIPHDDFDDDFDDDIPF